MEYQNSTSFEDKAFRAIFEQVAIETGTKFFSSLVNNLCSLLNAYGAWVTEYYEDQKVLNSLAFWLNDDFVKEYKYRIEETPCETVINNSSFIHIKENVKSIFPKFFDLEKIDAVSYMGYPLIDSRSKVIGHLAIINNKVMEAVPENREILKVFAIRAAAELQRFKSENERKEKERKLRRLVESAMDGIIEIDNNLIITMMNPAAEKLFNCKSAVIIGTCFLDLLEEDGQMIFLKTVKHLIDKPEGEKFTWISDSLNIKSIDNKEFQAEATISQYESRKETYYSIIIRNIDDKLVAAQKIHSLEVETEYLKEELKILNKFDSIVGQSRPLMKLLHEVSLVAKTDSTVLIYGETGTGKELIAKAIHSASSKRDKQLITINCAAIPAALIESEFFGHVAGAFTGATKKRIGRFELANGSTIFLDEIGELQLDLQAKLLRVLQEGEFEPVGSSQTIKINVRVIAATNRNLPEEISRGNFREDLYYRLNVYPLTVPPLRERGDDIIKLAELFAQRSARKIGIKLFPLSLENKFLLKSYKWPGNVRELQNIIERGVITSANGVINLSHLITHKEGQWNKVESSPSEKILSQIELLEVERQNIIRALTESKWKISGSDGAAKLIGVPASTLSSRIKALKINRPVQ